MVWYVLILFLTLTVLIRRRFIDSAAISVFLRKRYVAISLHNAVFILLCVSIFIEGPIHGPQSFLSANFIAVLFVTVWCMTFRSFMVKGSLPETYFTVTGNTLKIDVSRAFLPEMKTRRERESFADDLVLRIEELKQFGCDRVLLQSHLFQPGMRRLMSSALKKNHLSYTATSHPTSPGEKFSLNLLYGGKTRFRLLTTLKHKNGFKVHKTGTRFLITLN